VRRRVDVIPRIALAWNSPCTAQARSTSRVCPPGPVPVPQARYLTTVPYYGLPNVEPKEDGVKFRTAGARARAIWSV